MMRPLIAAIFLAAACSAAFAQKPTETPSRVPVRATATQPLPAEPPRSYSNATLRFRVSFPKGWQIAGDDLEPALREKGIDIGLKAPQNIGPASRLQVERALERVRVLVTAFRAAPGSPTAAILRIAAEDLTEVPEVRDAVDYFDLMRSQYAAMNLPADFKYSDTQAEQLGKRQFAFLDTQSSAGKKRIYATLRGRTALLFTLSYKRPEDLAEFRQVLAAADFAYR